MRKKILSIGEALIDFTPEETGCEIKQVQGFRPMVGGAPTNVCGAVAKLGGESMMITQLGQDPFGDKIVEYLEEYHVDTSLIQRTTMANTALAFVSLKSDGDREFSFYRKPSADMLLEKTSIKEAWFSEAYALHFCSLELVDAPVKAAHVQAIEYAKKHQCVISFDPNVRLPLWETPEACKTAIREFIPYADILKIADEELELITGCTDIKQAKEQLFQGNLKLLIYTKGSDGAEVYTANGVHVDLASNKVKAVDTTGAGDAFIGAFLYHLSTDGVEVDQLGDISEEKIIEYTTFANRFCEYSVQRHGAIASYPTMEEMQDRKR
ncbi:MAG: carbohydrate kinase [Lachnospiraceae bacterium]